MTGIGKATNCWGPPSKVFLKTLRIDEQSLNIDSYFFHCAITLPSMNVFKEKLLNRLILRDKLFKKLCGYYPIKYANICVSQFRWSSGTLKVIWSQDFFLVLCHSSLKMYDNRSTIVLANSSNRPTLTVTITVHQIRGSLRCSKRYLARFIWFLNDTSFDKFSSANKSILTTCLRFYTRLTVCIKQQKKKKIAVRRNNWPISTVRRKKRQP